MHQALIPPNRRAKTRKQRVVDVNEILHDQMVTFFA